jgi:hypothetical protein
MFVFYGQTRYSALSGGTIRVRKTDGPFAEGKRIRVKVTRRLVDQTWAFVDWLLTPTGGQVFEIRYSSVKLPTDGTIIVGHLPVLDWGAVYGLQVWDYSGSEPKFLGHVYPFGVVPRPWAPQVALFEVVAPEWGEDAKKLGGLFPDPPYDTFGTQNESYLGYIRRLRL